MATNDTLTREPTFAQWLYFHQEAPGAVGEVARFAMRDQCWPKRARTVTHFINHLAINHPGERGVPAELTVRDAFALYRTFLASGQPLPSRQGDRHGRQTKRVHKYYSVAEETSARIEDLTSPAKRPDGVGLLPGEVVDVAVAREHARVFRRARASA